ncbi:MAG: spore coat protein [Clostridia bacterium]|nr:spore coat protein [Clostridia bacterium]MBQ8289878.1 spore coat protein [Clostridia bacterium]
MMILTEKERGLLNDMKSQEELCIKKYEKYEREAKCPSLSGLFSTIKSAECTHLASVNSMLSGNEPESPAPISANNSEAVACSYENQADKDADCMLLSDMLAMEKHVSALYNTGIFEFCSPKVRKMLNHIQSEEQQHGEWMYAYMKANGMYNA